MQNKINLLFPVEIINRELDFRLFLACLGARETNRIWIGQPRAIYGLAHNVEGGVYVGKNIFGLPPNITWHRYRNLKKRGFRFIHLDEEGAIYRGGPEAWKHELRRRFDPTCMEPEDYICTWGDFQRDFYKSLEPKCSANIRTTGHPRFDIYKTPYREYYEPEAAGLRERFGDFILINSNLHRVNNHEGLDRVFSERLGYYVKDPQKRLQFFDRWHHLTTTFASFVRLINRLSVEFPDLNIVIRPHPSENQAFYKPPFGDVPNVHAVREGSVGPWLIACKAMIHDGCTTGLEGHLAGIPVINYKPIADPHHDSFLPNLFGTRCSTDEAVVEYIHNLLKTGAPAQDMSGTSSDGEPALPPEAHALLDNFQHNAFAKLIAVMHELESSMPPERSSYAPLRHTVQEGLRRSGYKFKTGVLRPRRKGHEKLGKFYGYENVDMEQKLELIQKITKTRIRYTVHSTELLSVESA
jgi:surface carbohydrate biosynthesis protein